MTFYLAPNNSIHDDMNGQAIDLLPKGCVPITEQEAHQLRTPTLEQKKEIMWDSIKAERDRRQAGGVLFGGHWFKTDERSRADYLSIITLSQLAGHAPSDVIRPGWRTMVDGVTVDMTMALAGGIIAAGAQQWFLIDNAAQSHKAAMESAADPASYDFSSGWPAVFGE